MKLKKEFIIAANKISALDADIRLAEFKKHRTLEPRVENYRFDLIHTLWPEAEYFDKRNIEGFCGPFMGKFLVIFRGTDSLWGWITNFMLSKKVIPYQETGTNPKIRVHNGFLRDYLIIRDYIHQKMKETDIKEVVFHGHSKGGSIAALAALDVQYNFPDKEIGAFVVGMPRIGNREFKESFESRLPKFTRCDYGSDLIPQIPFKWMGFTDLGHFIQLGPKRRWGIGKKSDHNWQLYYSGLVETLKDDELYS